MSHRIGLAGHGELRLQIILATNGEALLAWPLRAEGTEYEARWERSMCTEEDRNRHPKCMYGSSARGKLLKRKAGTSQTQDLTNCEETALWVKASTAVCCAFTPHPSPPHLSALVSAYEIVLKKLTRIVSHCTFAVRCTGCTERCATYSKNLLYTWWCHITHRNHAFECSLSTSPSTGCSQKPTKVILRVRKSGC